MKKSYILPCVEANTPLFYLLGKIPEDQLFFKEYNGLRHPLGIYNLSFKRIDDAVINFCKAYHSFMLNPDNNVERYHLNMRLGALNEKVDCRTEDAYEIDVIKKRLKEISERDREYRNSMITSYVEFLESMMAYLDDTFNILKTIFPITTVKKKTKSSSEWVMFADRKLFTTYQKEYQSYRQDLAYIVNSIKHKHGRLRFIVFNANGVGVIPGYFLETVRNGMVCPDRKIHRVYETMETAFSFHRDIKFHIFNLYRISSGLTNILNLYLKNQRGSIFEIGPNEDSNIKMWKLVSELPATFFVDEYIKPIPEVQLLDNNKIKLSLGEKHLNSPITDGRISGDLGGDGVTNQFQLPYWRQQ